MRHGVKKIRFRGGIDSTQMLVRKLVRNFIVEGKLTTTLDRAVVAKSQIERLVDKSKKGEKSEASKNFLLGKLGQQKVVKKMFDVVAPVFKNRIGGYVRIKKIGFRSGDGALIANMTWTEPVVETVEVMPKKLEEKKTEQKK